jgi:hypothetical protein
MFHVAIWRSHDHHTVLFRNNLCQWECVMWLQWGVHDYHNTILLGQSCASEDVSCDCSEEYMTTILCCLGQYRYRYLCTGEGVSWCDCSEEYMPITMLCSGQSVLVRICHVGVVRSTWLPTTPYNSSLISVELSAVQKNMPGKCDSRIF